MPAKASWERCHRCSESDDGHPLVAESEDRELPIDFRFIDKSARPLYRGIADELARQIRCGELEPGERLLTQDELSKLLGIARNTVCRAYQILDERCLVSTEVGRGTFVCRAPAASMPELEVIRCDSRAINLAVDSGWVRGWRAGDEEYRRLVASVESRDRIEERRSLPQPDVTKVGASWLSRSGLDCPAERIFVSAGHHHALLVSILATTHAGDRIATDRLCYPPLRRIAELLGRQVVPVELDSGSTDAASLDVVCRRHRPGLIYLMPHVHCATSATIGASRRNELIRVLRSHRIPFLEDDGLQPLADSSREPLSNRAPDLGIYLSGFSRLVTQELQLEFLAVPDAMRSRFDEASWATLPSPSGLSARIGKELIVSGMADEGVRRFRATLRLRRQIVGQTLDLARSSASLSPHIWIETKDDRHGEAIESRAGNAGVRILPANAFLGDPPRTEGNESFRICLLGPRTSSELEQGLIRLGEVLAVELAASAG